MNLSLWDGENKCGTIICEGRRFVMVKHGSYFQVFNSDGVFIKVLRIKNRDSEFHIFTSIKDFGNMKEEKELHISTSTSSYYVPLVTTGQNWA